jgi:hypothetical protein
MSSNKKMQGALPISALAPDADLYAADPATDVISMADFGVIDFFLHEGVGATGTALLTVESCDDVTPTTSTAVGFRYRVAQTADVFGAWTTVAAAGYTTIAGATSKIVQVQVESAGLSGDDNFVRLQIVEVVDSPVDAGVIAILSDPRYAEESVLTALA